MQVTHGIKMDKEVSDRVRSLALKRERTPHWIMKKAVEAYLEKEEKYELEKAEDMERIENYRLTGHAIDDQVVREWLIALSEGKRPPIPR